MLALGWLVLLLYVDAYEGLHVLLFRSPQRLKTLQGICRERYHKIQHSIVTLQKGGGGGRGPILEIKTILCSGQPDLATAKI